MDRITDLVEQHIHESESRLRHIDELMAQARAAPLSEPAASNSEALLRRIQLDRDRLARELEDVRRLQPRDRPEVATKGERLKGVLGNLGLELEKALAAVLERGR